MKTLHTIYSTFAKRNMESLRLLLVMLLILTVSSNMWAAEYTLVTSNSDLNNGDKVIIATKNSSGKPNTGVTGQNGNNDATVSSTESNWVQYTVGSASTSGWTLFDAGQEAYIAKPTGNHFKYSTTAGTCFVNTNGVLGCNNRYLQANGTYYRMYSGINNSYTPFYVWKVSASYTITAKSNNTSYGTVSLSGTTITASPKTGYRVSTTTPYTISPTSSAKVTQSENKFTVTPTANCTITINFEERPKYTVTLKDDNSILTQSTAGGSVDLPSRDGCVGYTFAGWTSTWTSEQSNWTTTKPAIINAGAYTPTANVNLYPVYTKTETTPGTTTTKTDYVLTDLANIKSTDVVVITSKNSSGSYYAMSNNNGTSSAPAATSVSVSSSKLSSALEDKFKWNISNNSGTLTIHPNGKTTTWLYCTSTNNGVRVGTNAAKAFTIDATSGYLKHTGTSRYIGVYNNADWRCYTSVNDNIKNQTLAFFVETTTTTTTSTTTTSYISVPNCCTPLAEVTGLKYSNITSNSITVAVPDDYLDKANASGYTFNCYSASTGGTPIATADESATSHTFTGLTKNTTYYFTVIAKGEGKYCNSIETSPRESSKTLPQYTVTLNPNGGTGNFSGWTNYTKTVDAGTQITLPTLSKTGYNFAGWNDGATTVTSTYTPTKDITLTARWTAIEYTITYNDTKGATNSNPTTYTIENEITFADLTNLPKGYNFTGWDPATITKGTTGDKTITAQWTAKALVNYRTDCDVVIKCDAYSFHTGDGTIATMEKEENIICFEEHGVAQGGLEHEWQINNYTIPEAEKFFVGYYGYFYNDNLGIGDTNGDKSRSVVSDWTNMYLAPSMTSDDPEHSPRLGHAKGAVGTLRIFEDSDWDNLFVGFIPDGYTVKFGETEYPLTMANADNHEYRTELLQYEPNNYANAVSVGVIDKNGNYVATANTQKMRHIFLKVNSDWASNNAKFSIYDIGAGAFKNGFMTLVPGSTDLYEGWVDKDCDKIIFVRHNADATSPSWENKWNQTGNLSLQANQNMFTIAAWDDQTDAGWANGTYTKYGKFRMYEDSKAINWYVNFYPYHALTYDKNAEDATGTMDMQFIEADAENKNVVVANCGFTRPGYRFKNWRKGETNTYFVAGVNHELVADVTFYAQWEAKKITITWDANGGSVNPTKSTYTYGGASIELPTPTRANYTFNGWFTTATGGTKITEVGTNNKPTEDVTYYAQWIEKATPTFTWSADSYTAALEADNTFPTLSNPNSLSVTYKSSDENVAKIDANGNITLGSEGKTTITAIGAESATHKSATDAYELIVVAANCKWVEVTDNTTLEDGDEVVISMTLSTGISYALPNDEATNTVPDAIKITNTTSFANDYIWIIGKNGNNLTFESYKNSGKFLTCNNADAGVRVNTGTNKIFIIDDTYGYLKNIANNRYLGVHSENIAWYSYALTNTGNFPQKIAGQTLKFYKRECLDSEHYWVEGNLTNVTCSPQLPQQLAKDGSITLTFTAADGYALPNDVTVTNATKTWNKTTGTLTISNPTGNVMVTVSAVELHTITWMVGNNPVLTEKVANTTGVTQTPASNPEGDAIGDCADTFLGWSEKSAGSTPQDVAYYDDLCTAAAMKAKHTSVTGDKIFYAVFAIATTTPGTSTTENNTYSHTITSQTWSATGAQTLNNVSWTLANNGGYYGYDGTKGQQVGSGSKPAKSMTLTTSGFASASKITSVTINTSGASDTNAKVSVKVGGTSYSCNTNTTPAISTTATDYKFTGNSTGEIVISWSQTSSKAIYFKSITVEYSNTTTTPDVTEYSDYVTNCCALAPATNLTVSGTTASTATLTWTAPSPTTGITKLQVRNAETDTVVVDNITVNTTTTTINGLTECTSYKYYVVSVGEDCEVVSNIVTAQPYGGAKTVNYDYNGGSGSVTSFTTSCTNQTITLPAATRTGYDFNGWYTDATGGTRVGGANDTYEPSTSPITLYAQWTKQIYSITFHANGGTGTMEDQKADENNKIAQLNANKFTRTGYAFVGWNTKANGTGTAYADQATDITLTGNLTLYAQWAPIVTLNDAGNEETAHPTTVNGTITLPNGANACDPYEFVGWTSVAIADWNEGINEPALVATTYTPTAPTTLYAVYKIQSEGNANAFKLSFEGSNGNTYYVDEYSNSPLRGYSNITKDDAVTFIKTKMYPNDDTRYYLYMEEKGEYLYYNGYFNTTSNTPSESQGWIIHAVGDKIKLQSTYSYDPKYLYFSDRDNYAINIDVNASGSEFNMLSAVTSTYVASPLCNQEIEIIFETGNGNFVDNAPATNPLTVSRGNVITLPTCEYPGYEFMGWLKDEQQEEPSDIIGTYYTGDYTVDGVSSTITFYAYYKAIPEEVEFTGKDDVELLMYYYDGTANYYYAVSHAAERGELSSKQNCFNATTWTFTNVGNMQYHIQDETGKYLGAYSDGDNDLILSATPKVWTFTEVNGLWKMVCENSPSRALMYISTGKTFANSAISNEGNGAYSYVALGICPSPTYTTNPVLSQGFSITNTAMVTSASGQKVKAASALTLETRNIELPCKFTITAPNITFYDNTGAEVTQLTASAASEQFELHFAYKPTAENTMEYPTITITDDEHKTYTIKNRIYARSLPDTFAIVAKVGNLWYALPSQGLNSTTPPAAYPVEVDDMADPTAVTAVPANADWSLRGVYEASRSDATKDRYVANGDNLVFVNNASPAMTLNASSSEKENYLLTDAQYNNYYSTNPGLYEWTPTTTDLETYQLTNEQRSRTLSVNTATVFGVHAQDKAVEQVRFLPIQDRYKPAALQVVEWKENSVVIMYNGDPVQTASVSVNGAAAQNTTLSAAQRDIAVYELAANGLAANPTQRLSITIGREKVILSIPYIISGETTDLTLLPGSTVAARQEVAKVSDLVILKGATLTAAGAKSNPYKFRNVTIYGGGKLVIPSESEAKGFGVSSLTMRVGAVESGNYKALYPQLVLNGSINTGNINIDYLTTYDRYYALSLPYQAYTRDILYPAEIYGDNLKTGNKASFALQWYDGEARASETRKGWKDLQEPDTLAPYQGYTFWGAPRKVSVNGESKRQNFGIHRIPIKPTADELIKGETTDKQVKVYAYSATNAYDAGWNFIGNPYLVQYGNMEDGHTSGLLGALTQNPETGVWEHTGNYRYITLTDDGKTYWQTPVSEAELYPFNTFFVQAGENGAVSFNASNPASLPARHYAAQQETAKEITTGIILTGNDQTDRTGLLIADNFTEEYDFNADLSKFENSGINLYTIGKDGKLAYMAINQALAEQPIPVGYSAPVEGLYTIAFDEDRYNATDISALYLIDYDSNEKTNLLHTDYSFVTAAGTNNQRFALQVAFVPANSTNVEWVGDATIQVGVEGHELILNNLPTDATVHVFDALGRLMYHTPTAPTEMQLTLPTGYYLVRIADKQHAVVTNIVIP